MPTLQELSATISSTLPNVKSGSLRFWGHWFGRPYDNCHSVISCEATDDCLRFHFDGGEVLAVWTPVGVEIDVTNFKILSASALRWTWYYYGRPQIPENLYFQDYALHSGKVAFRTNWDQTPVADIEDSAADFPAVEMF